MTAEQEAIERIARTTMVMAWQRHATVANDETHGWKCACGEWDQFDGLANHQWSKVLAALLSPSPCPTCGGTGKQRSLVSDIRGTKAWLTSAFSCFDCTDGTLPPLLRWNEDA